MIRTRSPWAIVIVLASAALLLAMACATSTANDSPSSETLNDLPPEFQRMEEVWRLLQREHIDGGTLDAETLSDGAIRGMLQALDDPYAAFLTKEQFSIDTQDIKGFFEGIGAEVGLRDGRITILAPMPDAPAELAGIRPGDLILEIEGESTRGISLLDAVRKIRGRSFSGFAAGDGLRDQHSQ